MESQSFGEWLRRKRKSLDLTRAALADRVGCSVATLRKLEDEERRPSVQMAERLMVIFEIPAGEQANFVRFARGNLQAAPPALPESLPWQEPPTPPRSNLPISLNALIGRETERSAVCGYLTDPAIRLVTLIGPPGIGKTRLAIETARDAHKDFPDGEFFIALDVFDDPSLIAPSILQALGHVEAKNCIIVQQLLEIIGEKRLLIILDNCEHLVDEIASLSVTLLSTCSHLTILATSRESLRVPGEWLYPVPALDVPPEGSLPDLESVTRFPALMLFAERARAVRPNFSITHENLPAVSAICTRLDGLPLAIELIASRLRLLSPQDLLKQLNDQFVLSSNGRRAVPAQKKTLGHAIDLTYRSLSTDEQKMFACLSVFAGGFNIETCEASMREMFPGQSIPDLITTLVNKSMVESYLDERGDVRFTMLLTIRQFAQNHLRRMGLETEARNLHLAHFIRFAEMGAVEMRGSHQVEWSQRLDRELDNLRTALEWSISSRQTKLALQLLGALGWPWEVRGHYKEARAWFEKISILPDAKQYPLPYARLLNHIGRHNWSQDHVVEARSQLEESCALMEQLGEPGEQTLAEALNWLGLVYLLSDNNLTDACTNFMRSLQLNQKWDDEKGIAISTFHLGIYESIFENDSTALHLLNQSLTSFQQFGDLFFMARASLFIGYIYLRQQKYDQALFYFEDRLRLDTETQFIDGMAEGWRDLGNYYRQQGFFEQASDYYEKCIKVCEEHGLNKPEVYYIAGLLALHLDDYELAQQKFISLLKQIQKTGEHSHLGMLLMGMAAVASGSNQPERAALLYGAADALIESNNIEYPNADRVELERHLRIMHNQLDEARFEQLSTRGRAMSLSRVFAFVLVNGAVVSMD